MGKPFDSELGCLASTYSWAMKKNIDPLTNPIFASASLPLLAVGSGGSFTAAYFASALYQKYAGKIAKAMTPLELVSSAPQLRDIAVLFLSAGGRNTDIIGAFKQVIMREPRRITVMCASPKSPLSLLADTYPQVGPGSEMSELLSLMKECRHRRRFMPRVLRRTGPNFKIS